MSTTNAMGRRVSLPLLGLTVLMTAVGASFNEECTKFLASEPQPVEAEFSEYNHVQMLVWDMKYEIEHKIDLVELGAIAEDNDTTTLCVGFGSTRTRVLENSDAEADDPVLTMAIETREFTAAGLVNVSSDCWAREREVSHCDPIFIPMTQVIKSSLFANSPLNEKFWTFLDDQNVKDDWVTHLEIKSLKEKFPGSWVSHLKLSSLQELVIKGNDWGRPEKLLSPLPALRKLDLTFNNIQELPSDTFTNALGLRSIILAKNNLSVFPANLNRLEALSLLDITNPEGRAQLTISAEDIKGLHRVNVFGLENINLAANVTALLDLPMLNFLNLSGCQIDHIDDIKSDIGVKPLHLLDLSKNSLSKLPPKLFSSLSKLHTLFLEYNLFESCPSFINNLPMLTVLNLSHNKLSRVTTLCFDKPHNSLKYLDLSYNQISTITDRVFASLNSLRELDLSNNKLANIQSSFFHGVSHLNLLDLSYNNISDIHIKDIEIGDLRLAGNHLTSLWNLTDSETGIYKLDLSMNSITQLQVSSLRVEVLNLSYNGIYELPKPFLDHVNSSVSTLDLGQNSFNCCSTHLSDIKQWLKDTTVDIQNVGTKRAMTCLIPGENQRYHIRSFVDDDELCKTTELTRRSNISGGSETSVLYGVIGFLTVLVLALGMALAYFVYKQRHNVLTWFKFTDS